MNYVWFRMYCSLIVVLSVSCKDKSQEYKPPVEVLTTVAMDAAPQGEMPSLMTQKYCGTHGVAAGMIYDMVSRTCVCKRGEYDPKIGKCVEKKSEAVYPRFEEPMDSHGPTADEREEIMRTDLLRNAPSLLKRWRTYKSDDAKALLVAALCEYNLNGKKLGLEKKELRTLKKDCPYEDDTP